eukprot:TRINITY_DN381_c0_g1_i5.p2 TRINITY_DN381_c0_g1~~TRINITY_DN381_c0_g1_i5.p2  ORF type:complete len:155 (+),score=21.37 TRINITY_DN381_c0_g1_i5:543-1007(+)
MGGGLNVSPTRSDSLVSVLVHSQLFKSTVGLEVRCGVEKKFPHKDDQKRSLIVILLTEVREGGDALSFRSEHSIFVRSSLHAESTVFEKLKNANSREHMARDQKEKEKFFEIVGGRKRTSPVRSVSIFILKERVEIEINIINKKKKKKKKSTLR